MNPTNLLEAALELQRQDTPFAMVTVLRALAPASARAGDKALVTADGALMGWVGGGCAQPAVVKAARLALADGQPRNIRIAPAETGSERTLDDVMEFGMACHSGGTLELFIDPVLPTARLVVMGDSPVARSLVGLASRVGFEVHVVAQGASADDFADARSVLADDSKERVCEAITHADFVVVATQGRRDLQALRAALALPARNRWFVSSARKAEVLKASLLAAGELAHDVASLEAPAGESIGARTPEEIALSVLASVVSRRRRPHHTATVPPTAPAASVVSAAAVSTAAPSAAAKATVAPAPAKPAALPGDVFSAVKTGGSCCGG